MKKGILFAASLLSILGFVAVAQAAAPTVSAGSAQTITLPTSSVLLSGTAVFNAPATAIASSSWALTSGPSGATVTIAPNALIATASGLTVAGNYVFTLTSTDNATPTAFSASAPVTVTVNPAVSLKPVVNAGASQTITSPNAVSSLSGSATVAAGRTITSYSWAQTSGPVTSVIATPTTAATSVSGLSAVGTYAYTLTVTDSTGATGSAQATITVNMNQNPLPVVTPMKRMRLNINENGRVELHGSLEALTGSVLTVKVYGISFTVNATNAKFTGPVKDFSLYKIGDIVAVQGSLDTTATTPTINARNVRDMSIQNEKIKKNREMERDEEDSMDKEHGNKFPSLDGKGGQNGFNLGGRGGEHGGRGGDRGGRGDN